MRLSLDMAVFLGIVCSCSLAQTPMDVQQVTTIERSGKLSTCDYKPAVKEAPFFRRLSESEQITGSPMTEYSIHGKQGRYVSWFGVVRDAVEAKPGGVTLLIEQKAFDGLTDCHIMLVSFKGLGDFRAVYFPGHEQVPPLSLVRIYGTVTTEKNGIPEVKAEYVRVWPQLTFTFSDDGPKDAGNPEWARLCTLCRQGKRIYNPYPAREYYVQTLGAAPVNRIAGSDGQTASPAGNPSAAAGVRGLVRVDVEDPPIFLFKPESWVVTPGHTPTQLRVKVSEPGGAARVDAIFTDNHSARLNSLSLLATFAEQMRQKNPDLQLSQVMACKDKAISCAVATITFTGDGVPMQGRFFFHADANQAVIRGYQAPVKEFAAKRPLLLDILTNIHIGSAEGQQVTAQPALNVQFTQRQAADGSWRLSLPADWNFTGSKGMVLAGAPGGAAGFLFTSFPIMPPRLGLPPTAIISRYLSPPESIQMIWGKFKNRQIQMIGSTPDPQTGNQCAMQIGKRCEAADVQLSWVSPEGNACVGSFKVLNALPGIMGDWFSIVAGTWGPSNELDRYMPVLEQVANSFSINDQYAQQYIQQGMQNLRRLEAQTRQSVNSLYQAIDDNRRDAERRSATRERSAWAYSDAILGNSYWISEVEGGKVYATDPWGTTDTYNGNRLEGAPYDYFNFEGQNPNYPSETMREVNSYDLLHPPQ